MLGRGRITALLCVGVALAWALDSILALAATALVVPLWAFLEPRSGECWRHAWVAYRVVFGRVDDLGHIETRLWRCRKCPRVKARTYVKNRRTR